MTRWFRHYVGMMRDEKLVRAAMKSRQPVERVIWVWGALLESAAEINDGGRFDFEPVDGAYFLRCDDSDIVSILSAMADLGRVSEGRVSNWTERQFESDGSKDRQQRYRDRQKSARDVTPPSPDVEVTPQETYSESEPDTEKEKPPAHSEPSEGGRDLFDEIWQEFPMNPTSSEAGARKAFGAIDVADRAALLDAVRRYAAWFVADSEARKRTPEAGKRFVPKLSTWISNGSWREAGALAAKADKAATVPMIRLNRSIEADVWLECELIMCKKAPTSDWSWSFPADVVSQARANVALNVEHAA